MPHNDILNDPNIKQILLDYQKVHPELVEKYVVMDKEPDYLFVVNESRAPVLTDQLKAINESYSSEHGAYKDKNGVVDNFGLLQMNEERKFLDFKMFPFSGNKYGEDEGKNKTLVLVYFSDRILNLKAEEIEMMVHTQNSYQTLPFILTAQNNFMRFNASQKYTLIKALFNEEFDTQVLVEA